MDNTSSPEACATRTKVLTALINRLQPQSGPPTSDHAKSANGKAYHLVATLLTRGVEDRRHGRSDIAVTGAHYVTGASVTVVISDPVASSVTSDPSSSPPLNAELSPPHIQNQSRHNSHKGFSCQSVGPNPLSLEEICETLYVLLSKLDLTRLLSRE
jgi:hypothetical protein